MEYFKDYKTPIKKLCKCFQKSRDEWKDKCLKSKKDIKRLKNQNKYSQKRIYDLKQT
ncbi:hypothetical protein MHK_006457, partial [Candidatus Magnetomorum sp. HK-1]